jgi:hypothetical protein
MSVRKSMTHALVAALLSLGVAACLGAEGGKKQITDPSKISQIQKGVSTKASIKAAFGDPPNIDFAENGDEVWSYFYTNVSIDPASYIPYVGAVAGGGSTQLLV